MNKYIKNLLCFLSINNLNLNGMREVNYDRVDTYSEHGLYLYQYRFPLLKNFNDNYNITFKNVRYGIVANKDEIVENEVSENSTIYHINIRQIPEIFTDQHTTPYRPRFFDVWNNVYIKMQDIKIQISNPEKNNGIKESNIYLSAKTCCEIESILLKYIYIFPITLTNTDYRYNKNISDVHHNIVNNILDTLFLKFYIKLDKDNKNTIIFDLQEKTVTIDPNIIDPNNKKSTILNIYEFIKDFSLEIEKKIKKLKDSTTEYKLLTSMYQMINNDKKDDDSEFSIIRLSEEQRKIELKKGREGFFKIC